MRSAIDFLDNAYFDAQDAHEQPCGHEARVMAWFSKARSVNE
ncbi:hypothetical protein [Komagataeibacter nataicola]|nr:hypothetical protein [Komagataeibacter nataicola]WNM08168.1 hypothetical protein RI056_14900 [Komagataeibacter nataicola]